MASASSSAGKESACSAGDPGLIPGLGRSPEGGSSYPFQYFWASLVVQLVKNPPTMQETWVRPLEKGKTTHSSILAWKSHGLYSLWGRKESDMTEPLSLHSAHSGVFIAVRPGSKISHFKGPF